MSKNVQQFGPLTLSYYLPSQDGWNTGGVRGGSNGTFLNPDSNMPAGFLAFGSRGITDSYDDGAFLIVAVDYQAVVPSIGWTQIWSTADVSGGENGFVFQPIVPVGYVALGVVFTNYGYPSFNVACVAQQYVTQGDTNTLWTTAGVHGGANLSLYTAILDASTAPPSSDLDATIAIPTSTFVADPTLSYVLNVPTPYITAPTVLTNPPRLTSHTSPGDTTPTVADGSVTLPYSLVDADKSKGNAWRAQNSPFYTLKRTCYWTNLGFLDNETTKEQVLARTAVTGVTNVRGSQFSHTVGIEVGGEGGVSFLGTGGKVSVSVNYQFGYSTSTSREELSQSSEELTLTVPKDSAGIIWLATRAMSLYRTNGSLVDPGNGSVLLFNASSYVMDQYPNTVNVLKPKSLIKNAKAALPA